ncbi:uncharacterized protein LOC134740232 [Pongo pygmaeus]|uniref:uncharacterized protein LOC134740232 n=1 Tax=Pongo pygmaeus TaxID=9600 RepID=UPI00300D8367
MRARWRLFKATGGVAAPPEPGSCPRPRAASPAPGRGVPGATRPHHPHLSAPHPLWRHFNQGEGRSCPCPSPPPPSSNRGDFCPNLGRKRDARPSAFGDPLWTRPQGENTSTVWTWADFLEKLLDATDSTTDQLGCCCLQTSPLLKDSCSHQLWNFLEPNLSPDCLQGPIGFWITSWRRLTGTWEGSWEVPDHSQGAAWIPDISGLVSGPGWGTQRWSRTHKQHLRAPRVARREAPALVQLALGP